MHLVNGSAQMAYFIAGSKLLFVFITVLTDPLHNGHELCDRTGNIAGHHPGYDKENTHNKKQDYDKEINGRSEYVIKRLFGNTFQKDKA